VEVPDERPDPAGGRQVVIGDEGIQDIAWDVVENVAALLVEPRLRGAPW